MRVLVCGDRNWRDEQLIAEVLNSFYISTLIEGECRGADILAREYAKNYNIFYLPFPAEWNRYNKGAGHIRNKQMLEEGKPDLVVAFHNCIEESRGTANMLCQAEDNDIPYCLIGEKG